MFHVNTKYKSRYPGGSYFLCIYIMTVYRVSASPNLFRLLQFVNYPHLKKQASEEDILKIQASSPQALSFPAYPGDILRHVCKRDPVARQATPVFHR